MEEIYQDEFAKVSLALTSAQIAKKDFVGEYGVGEDLSFNFIGWKNGKLKIITQLNKELMKESPPLRLGRCMDMCRIMKAHWEIDSLSMIAEGYCSTDPIKTKGLDLAKAFIDPAEDVNECITVTHVETSYDEEPMLTLVSVNYKYGKNNKVDFDDVRVYPQGAVNVLRDKSYPAMLYKSVRDSFYIDDTDTDAVVEKLLRMGFHVQVVD